MSEIYKKDMESMMITQGFSNWLKGNHNYKKQREIQELKLIG